MTATVESWMQAHHILQPHSFKFGLPVYDVAPGTTKFVLSNDGTSVYRIVGDVDGRVIVPLLERDGHDLPDMAMAMVEAVLMERKLPSYEADTVHDAILVGASALHDMDLKLHFVLVRTGTELCNPVAGATVVYHPDVEPDLVICLPAPEFIGVMPTVGDDIFGMMVHNPDAVVPVRT